MFNKTYIQQGSRSIHSDVTVTEKKAPTDESVKLLMEMERAAMDKIIASIPLKSNEFTGHLIVRNEHLSGTRVCEVRFKLNGRDGCSKTEIGFMEKFPSEEAAMKILKDVQEEVSRMICVQIFHQALKDREL